MFEGFFDFSGMVWWILPVIFVAKVVEVTLTTLRLILVNRGFRSLGTAIALVEIIIWVTVASQVLQDINALKGLVYALGFALGVYVGSLVEEKLAFGKVLLQVICSEEESEAVIEMIHEERIGLTVLDGKGYESKKKVLLIYVERSQTTELLNSIKETDPGAVIGVSDINNLTGGYLPKRRRQFFK